MYSTDLHAIFAILVYSLVRSIRLPARLVISGLDRGGKKVRYIQGQRNFPSGVEWAHIYLQIGDRPYGEPVWYYAEPTLRVPLGWDVVDNDASSLPEMRGQFGASADTSAGAAPSSGLSDTHRLIAAFLGGALAYHLWQRSRG